MRQSTGSKPRRELAGALSADGVDGTVRLDELGKLLRRIRREQDMSLAEVAEGSGLSASFISLVETGKSDIGFGRLMRLLAYYGAGLADFLPQPRSRSGEVVRSGEWLHVYSPAEGIAMFLLSPDARRTMMPLLVRYKPGGKTADFTSHPGEEFIFVIEGSLELTIDGCEPVLLKAGDSVYFYSDAPHRLANPDSIETRMIVAITPPTW